MKEKILKIERRYCPICDQEHDIILKEKETSVTIKGMNIPYIEKVYFCENADSEECEFASAKMMNENLLAARNAYRKMNGLLTSDEIKNIREKYSLSQLELAKLLDYGDITITRYETKQIQDKSHDEQMRHFATDSSYALECLLRHENDFKRKRFLELKEIFLNIVSNEGEEQTSRKLLDLTYAKWNEPSEYNGNKILDISKLEAVISYFAKELKCLYKVKLMKMLWYADMLCFKQYNHSITGLVYSHESMGALPVGHYKIMSLNNVLFQEQFDDQSNFSSIQILPNNKIHYEFSKDEQAILDHVLNKFRDFTGKELSEYMHKEKAYVCTSDGELISYKWANELV